MCSTNGVAVLWQLSAIFDAHLRDKPTTSTALLFLPCLGWKGKGRKEFEIQNEVELGELLLSLNYLPSAGRLNVDIIRAKQLLQTDMSQGSDPFVKIQLVHGLKLTKTKKTSCMRGTIDPFYNESFSFKVPQEELENASLVFTVYGHNVKSSNDFIGRIVIGQYSTGAPESNHWRRMLNAHRTAVEQWHSLRSREECDRVSPASLEVT
uniref:Synaptotagmin-17 n=1 Tax=Aquila chrysaetos chrysaetos TaxID=223781 RepID=A0A663ERV7_AQUCH